jgi:hypothetical protein
MTENDINIYNYGKMYTIRCRTENNLIYVGSIIQPLHKRWDADLVQTWCRLCILGETKTLFDPFWRARRANSIGLIAPKLCRP